MLDQVGIVNSETLKNVLEEWRSNVAYIPQDALLINNTITSIMIDWINEVMFDITEEVHTMNMYNRIYIPEKYRFFFPGKDMEFIL